MAPTSLFTWGMAFSIANATVLSSALILVRTSPMLIFSRWRYLLDCSVILVNSFIARLFYSWPSPGCHVFNFGGIVSVPAWDFSAPGPAQIHRTGKARAAHPGIHGPHCLQSSQDISI